MTLLRQQQKVEMLSARATQSALRACELRHRISQSMVNRLQQPDMLIWAFSAGALSGSRLSQNSVSHVKSIVNWFNTVSVLWGIFSSQVDESR